MSGEVSETPAVAQPSEKKGFEVATDNGAPPAATPTSDVNKEKGDVSGEKDDVSEEGAADNEEGLVPDSLRSPVQTRVRRISAELRRAGKGLCTAAASRLSLPTAPRALRRRSWHCDDKDNDEDDDETTEEDCLLRNGGEDDDGGGGAGGEVGGKEAKLGSGGQAGLGARSKSSESLLARRGKCRGADLSPRLSRARPGASGGGGERSFLARRWEAMKTSKSRGGTRFTDGEADGDGADTPPPVSGEPAGGDPDTAPPQAGEADPWDSTPVVFEPLTLDPRFPTPAVTISVEQPSATVQSTNPFWD